MNTLMSRTPNDGTDVNMLEYFVLVWATKGHRGQYSSVRFITQREISTYDDVISMTEVIREKLGAKQLVVMDWKPLPGLTETDEEINEQA